MVLEEFHCTEENNKRLLELRKCAEQQQAKSYKEFEQYQQDKKHYDALSPEEKETIEPPIAKMPDFILYPWENKCDKSDFIYVSYEKRPESSECNDFIKGWVHIHIRTFTTRVRDSSKLSKTRRLIHSTLKIAHVNYISTNQNKTKTGHGVGKEMMTFMEEKMREKECHFVELMPLPDVVGFYTKLGYELEFEDVNYYNKWFVDKKQYTKELKLYEHQLNEENKKITKEMEEAEEQDFIPIYEQLSPEEQENYHRQQREDSFTRISLIFTYEEGGIEEVKQMLQ
jgi:hypothetical protein